MAAWLASLCLMGCPRAGLHAFDPSLPDDDGSPVVEATALPPRQVLEGAADSDDPRYRARSYAMGIRLGWGADWVHRALDDGSPWVQRAAAEALAARGDDESRRDLQEFAVRTGGDPMARALAAIRAPGPMAAAALSVAWQQEPRPWLRAPLALAAMVNGDGAARDALAAALRTGKLPLDMDLFDEIGRTGDHTLTEPLREAQQVVEEDLVLPIAAARLRLGDGRAEEPFRKAVAGSDVQRRLEALDYLVELDHEVVQGLIHKARSAGPELVSWYAELSEAARAGTDPGLFDRGASDPDPEVRELAVRFAEQAAAGSANRRVVRTARAVVIGALEDRDPSVRIAGLRACWNLHLEEAQPAALALAAGFHSLVQLEAAGTALALR